MFLKTNLNEQFDYGDFGDFGHARHASIPRIRMSLWTVQQKWYLDKRDNWKYAIQLEECIVVEHRDSLRWPGRDTLDMFVDWNNKKWKKFILIFPIFWLILYEKDENTLTIEIVDKYSHYGIHDHTQAG